MFRAERLDTHLLVDKKPELINIVEVVTGLKQVCLKVRVCIDGVEGLGLFRPEETLKLTPDPRIPIPEEIYRDVAYFRVDQLLDWNVSAPIVPWELKPGKPGVLRPYWPNINKVQPYDTSRERLMEKGIFWQHLAVLDYICAVIDRSANDIMRVQPENQEVVIDSGLSFVDGLEFVTQHSVIRSALAGVPLDLSIIEDLAYISEQDLKCRVGEFLNQEAIDFVMARIQQLLTKQVVL